MEVLDLDALSVVRSSKVLTKQAAVSPRVDMGSLLSGNHSPFGM